MIAAAIPGAAQRWNQLGKILLLALAYFASGKLGLSFPTQYNHISLFWLPTGIAVAALLRLGPSCCISGIFLGTLLIELSLDLSLPPAIGIAAGNTLAPLATVWLLRRWQFDANFARQRDLFALIAAAALGMLLSASVGVSMLRFGNLLPTGQTSMAWLDWWLGDTAGVLLAGPLLLSITRISRRKFLLRPSESLLCGLLLCTTGWMVFFFDYQSHTMPLAFLPLPLVVWAALRQGVTGTSLAVLLLSSFTAIGTALGKGVFGTMPAETGMYLAWLYMFIVVLTGLMVTTLLGEREKTEASLKRVNELLALAQREAKAGVWDWELASGKLTWSDELFTLFGLAPKTAEANFETWRSLIHPADLQTAEDRISEAVKNGIPLYNEYRIVLPGGETKWIVSFGNSSYDENTGTERMSGLCIDITEHKQTEDQLRFNEKLLRQAQSVAKLGSWRIKRQDNQLLWSDETYRIFGIPAGTPLNYQTFLNRVHPDDRVLVDSAWRAAVRGAPYHIEHRIVVNGETRWVEERAQLDFDAQGAFHSGTGSAQDITERKRVEEQLLNSLHQLEEKELSKTRFLAAAGHDLRQPVAAANLFVDALKLTSPTLHQSELIERLDQSMSVFSSMLGRLLDISKFDAGLVKPQITSFNLAELFNWLEQNFAQTALKQQLRFRLFFPMNQSLIVRTDIGLLQSVLMNLVSNAIKFTVHGGILISARTRGDQVLLQVWDTGIGIAGADLPRIFDEFYQAANPQRSREAGLGLGLSISQRAMLLLGGKVTCRSHPGHGSVFELSLPLNGHTHAIEPMPINSIPTAITNEMVVRGKRIVVVEDDALVAAGMVELLQGLGAEVRHFLNAEEALRHTGITGTDFFIADYSLGGKLTGLDFLKAVQSKKQTPIHAVILTGETSSQFISSVADSPWPVLHKPINYAKLISGLHLFTDQ